MRDQPFRVVLRGYETAQVDHRLEELAQRAEEARRDADQLAEWVRVLESQPLPEGSAEGPPPATLVHLGQRVAEIFRLAEEEARDFLERGREDLEEERRTVAAEASRQRSDAASHAEQLRIDAEAEAARVLDDASRRAEERLDAAERDAAVRRQEAAAVHEQQRAKAAQAVADFESTLARRLDAAEDDFTTQVRAHQQLLAELEAGLVESRTTAQRMRGEVLGENRRLIEAAEQQAATIIGDALARADRIRADTGRELAEAIRRRDRVNAQLANVRHKLAALTGGGGSMTMTASPPPAPADSGPDHSPLGARR